MINYREIMWLDNVGYSRRQIERCAHCSHHTVKRVLESACGQILSITAAPSVRTIGSVLKNSQSEQQPEQPAPSEKYGITRGSAYYGKGGGSKC